MIGMDISPPTIQGTLSSFTLLYHLHYQRMKLVFQLLVILSLLVRVDDGGCAVSHVVGGRFPEETEEWQ
jgi:hypothetical protein